ncbi:DUF2194 domain-containing protein [candidate division KSB1 bacterium]|nr:DUF2194 domain-containing protein [candidate division KSB1 bacterium]
MKKKHFICFFIVCYTFAIFITPVFVQPKQKKRILVLFKSSEGFSSQNNLFRVHLHKPLSRQRYQFDYQDIELGIPDDEKMKNYQGIISWYTGSVMKEPEKYLFWLTRQLNAGRKMVILDNLGAFSPDGKTWLSEDALNRFYLQFGLEFKGQWTDKSDLLEIVKFEKQVIGKEISIKSKSLHNYFKINSIHPQNKSYLLVNRKDIPEGESHVIIQTPFGGMALQGYLFETINGKTRFFLDLPRFINTCLSRLVRKQDLPQKKVLGLLKKAENPIASESYIHRFAFKPLLEMGYATDYHFIENGFPPANVMKDYAAILSWFQTAEMLDGEQYIDWLLDQILAGRKVIILGNFGAFKAFKENVSATNHDLSIDWWIIWTKLNNFFYPFGLEFLGGWTGDSTVLEIKGKAPAMVEKDLPLVKTDLTHYYTWHSVHPENKIYLEVMRNDQSISESAFVVRTPFGGMAFEGYLMKWDANENQLKFRINLAAFLKDCLTYPAKQLPASIPLITHAQILTDEFKQKTEMPLKSASSLPDAPNEIKRWILALYDGAESPDLDQNPIRTRAEVILNHLGLLVEHWDLQKGLPTVEKMEKFRGILTWFHDPVMKNSAEYADWLQEQIQNGKKVVIFGNFGAIYDQKNQLPTPNVKAVFNSLDLRYWDLKILPGKKQKIIHKSNEMLDFEAPIDLKAMQPILTKVTSENPANKVYLSISDSRIGKVDAIVITPKGGIALDETPFKEGIKNKEWMENLNAVLKGRGELETAENEPIGFWRINPFQFFTEALALKNLPIPDVTTLNGRRIFYSHIDGDGLTGISLIDLKSYASEFVRDQILKKYPLPISASVITKEIEEKGFPFYNRGYLVAKSIFALENIEPSTHSYSHPYDWRHGDMDARLSNDQWEWDVKGLDYNQEIYASVRFIEKNLLPPAKKVNLYLWSGRCNPDERPLERLEHLSVRNMNGGDPIFDTRFPSYSTLCPRATRINGYWQYHTSASNDFIYTKGWTRNFDNMANLVDHFKRTETPVRIMPMNIYIHFYIGDRQAGLDGLKKAYDYCLNSAIAPLFTSEYVGIVEDFIGLRQFALPEGGFRIMHPGELRTIRFDNCQQYPDLNRCNGVIGYIHHQNSLYVHLNDEMQHDIYLSDNLPGQVYLKSCSHYVDKWQATSELVSFQMRGLGKCEFCIANLPPANNYRLIIQKVDQGSRPAAIVNDSISTDKNGDLKFITILEGYQGKYLVKLTRNE